MLKRLLLLVLFCGSTLYSQDYFVKKFHPFNTNIPSPEEFLGYSIGEHHTRHDLIVSYLENLLKYLTGPPFITMVRPMKVENW